MVKTITIEVPEWLSEEELRLLYRLVKSNRRLVEELLKEYSLLKLQEESLKEFLESEPDLYSEEDVER